jgi:hypothetical protein
MKAMRKFLKYTCLFFGLLVCFRGPIYRACFRYALVGERTVIPNTIRNFEDLTIFDAQKRAAKKLYFVFERAETNPIKIETSTELQAAHCIGYSAYTASLIAAGHPELKVRHRVARIYFLGYNVHDWFSSPFFKDHDVVEVINMRKNEVYLLDPSLYDYFRIERVEASTR